VDAVLSDKAEEHHDRIRHETGAAADVIPRFASCRQFHETSDVFRGDLHPQRCPQRIEAERAEILVEVTLSWRQGYRLDPGLVRPVLSAHEN